MSFASKRIGAGWDEYFTGPSVKTLLNAMGVGLLFPKEFPLAKTSVSSDGEISFKLIEGERKAVIDVGEDEEYGYAYFQDGRFVPGKEEAKVSDPKLPRDLLTYFLRKE